MDPPTFITVDSNYSLPENSSIIDIVASGNGDISLTGNSQNNTIQGNSGNNTYQGNGGNDTLNDFAGGNDVYIYNLGDGHDWINDNGGTDTTRKKCKSNC